MLFLQGVVASLHPEAAVADEPARTPWPTMDGYICGFCEQVHHGGLEDSWAGRRVGGWV